MTKFMPYDSADFLTSPEAVTAYLEEARATGDQELINHAEIVAGRARKRLDLDPALDDLIERYSETLAYLAKPAGNEEG